MAFQILPSAVARTAQVDPSLYEFIAYCKYDRVYASPIMDQVLSFKSLSDPNADDAGQNCVYFILKTGDHGQWLQVSAIYRDKITQDTVLELKYTHEFSELLQAAFYCLAPLDDCDLYRRIERDDVLVACDINAIWNNEFLDFPTASDKQSPP